ncbi:MAG: carbonic anhydrase [Snowella sp.]|nr:carbonic anhydrase [Snowella sp.]
MSTALLPPTLNRRHLLQYGGGLLGTSLMATILGNGLSNPAIAAPQTLGNNPITPDEALATLLAGNQRFIERKRLNPHQTPERLTEVAQQQTPFAALLCCADSRVPAEMIFDQGFGDLFVCRVAGNIATPEEIGSLEFGTWVLGAKVLMVMGHQGCGAVKATLEKKHFSREIDRLVEEIQIGLTATETKASSPNLEQAVKTNVLYQVKQLTQSPVLSELIRKNQLKIVGAYYDLNTNQVSLLS